MVGGVWKVGDGEDVGEGGSGREEGVVGVAGRGMWGVVKIGFKVKSGNAMGGLGVIVVIGALGIPRFIF